jgi:hypothetical protein
MKNIDVIKMKGDMVLTGSIFNLSWSVTFYFILLKGHQTILVCVIFWVGVLLPLPVK